MYSFCIGLLLAIQCFVYIIPFSLLSNIQLYEYTSLFIHPFVDGFLGLFLALIIILVQVFLWAYIFISRIKI